MIGTSKRRAFSAALILVGAVALYNWVVSPHVGYLHAMRRLEPVVGRMVEQRQRIRGALDGKRQKLRSLQREFAETRQGFFTREESEAFTHNLQSFIEQVGCSIVIADFTYGSDGKQDRGPGMPAAVQDYHIGVIVWGYYDEITALLDRLQNNQPIVWVDSCRMDLLDARGGMLECRLALTTYVLWEEGESCP